MSILFACIASTLVAAFAATTTYALTRDRQWFWASVNLLSVVAVLTVVGCCVGLKCSDFETLPLCSGHHGELHANAGAFKRWTRAHIREWSDENIAFTLKLFADAHAEAGLPVPGKVAA